MSRLTLTTSGRLLLSVVSAVVVLGSIGCHSSHQGYRYNHCVDKFIARKRASVQAWYVWRQCADRCPCDRASDYRRGFIDGYCNVALGGDGCAPVVPPNRYWGWRYQDSGGAECVAAWYEGYPVGVAAALQTGSHYEIQTIVPETSEYEDFRDEFYNHYDNNANSLAPTPDEAPVLAPTTVPESDFNGVLPEVPDPVDSDPLDYETQDLIDAPVAPALDEATDTTETLDETDLLDSLEALERETLQRAAK